MFRVLHEVTITQSLLMSTLTIKEVSLLLHVHEQTIRRWANRGLIKVYRIGPRGDRRFSRDDIDAFLQTDTDGIGLGH